MSWRVGDDRPCLHGVRILLVEDEPETLALLACHLRRRGAEVTETSTAEDALRACGRSMPDVVISDLSLPLPGIDGWEMIRRFRQSGASAPAIALSANTRLEDAARALRAGFDAHIAKPVGDDDVVAAVLSVLDLRPPANSRRGAKLGTAVDAAR